MSTKRFKATLAMLACAAPAAAQTITALGTFGPNGGGNSSGAAAVSADGQFVVGTASAAPSSLVAVRWTPTGMQNLGTLPGGDILVGVDMSADGNWMTGWGTTPNETHTFRCFANGAVQDLGSLGGNNAPCAISDDGAIIVGEMSSPSGSVIYRWTQAGGFQTIGANPGTDRARDLSGDGTTIVGYSDGFSFTNGFRWTQAGGMVVLPPLPGGNHALATAVSYDGSYIAGHSENGVTVAACRWYGGVPQDIGVLSGFSVSRANAIDHSGLVIAGDCHNPPSFNDAWVWTEPRGIMRLTDYLAGEGIDLTGWSGLHDCVGISDDGTALVGNGTYQGEPRGYVVRDLPPLCGPWIADHPVSQAVCFDGTTALTLIAYGPTSSILPSIQWQKWNGSAWVDLVDGPTALGTQISGVYSYLLTLATCNTDAAGNYRAVVYAGCAVGYTNAATVTVNISGPNIFVQPQEIDVCPDGSATFTFTQFNSSFDTPFTYQWQYETTPNVFLPLPNGATTVWDGNNSGEGGIVSGTNTPAMTIAADLANSRLLSAAHYRQYRCVITNACASVPTAPAGLKVYTSCSQADLNGDDVVDFFDIDPFLLALFDPQAYAAQYPDVHPDNADCNNDGAVDFFDIDPFLACLFGACP